MKKISLLALLQGLAIFVIVGLIAYFVRGDFFFRQLAPIFGVLAALFRLGTASLMKVFVPTLYDAPKQEEKDKASKG